MVSLLTLPAAPDVVASASACEQFPVELGDIAVIGDSYTAGSSVGGRGEHSWPVRLQDSLRCEGMAIELAIGADPGSGYVKVGGKGTVFLDQVPRVVTPSDRLVVLFGSLNDGSVPAEQLSLAVRRTFEEVLSVAPHTQLLVVGPPWVDNGPPARVLRSRDIVRNEAVAAGALFVDPIDEGWFGTHPELIGADKIHPTDAGHDYIAAKIEPLIARVLLSKG